MILGNLADSGRYAAVHPGLAAGLEFLQRGDLASLVDGRYEIAGEQIFAIIARDLGRGQADAFLEFHRRFIDIQFVVSGVDLIGWQPTDQCRRVKQAYDADRDLGFYCDRPGTWCRVPAGSFAVFFPEDAHAPLGCTGPVHKVVVKVAVES